MIRFFKGRDIADVFEDFSEDALARGLKEGFIDGQAVLRDLRKVEQATGMELLPPGYGIDPAAGEVDTMPLLEGFSKLARAHVRGYSGLAPKRAAMLEKGFRDGTLDRTKYDGHSSRGPRFSMAEHDLLETHAEIPEVMPARRRPVARGGPALACWGHGSNHTECRGRDE